MQRKDRTKIMFADTLEEMLMTMPLDKIRVSKLCESCGATPPTFYYYFHDKYELIAWMFLQDFSGTVGDDSPGYNTEVMNKMTQRMEARKTFYRKAFTDQSQNSISDYMQAFNIQLSRDAVKNLTGEELTPNQLFAVKYHVYGVMGMIREWLFGEDVTIEELNQYFYERTPDFLKKALAAYPYSADNILAKVGKKTRE